MKALHACTAASIAVMFSGFVALQVPASAHAGMAVAAAGARVLTGELVVTNAAKNQFRLVQHQGFFTAPAGTSVEALGGKPVQVELGLDGRVVQITPMQIHVEPITHGFEVVSGELLQRNPATHTFTLAGDDRTYVAPKGIDVGSYVGRTVEVRLDEQGQVMNINLVARFGDVPMSRKCMFDGASVSSGSSICRDGRTLRCTDGEWVDAGTPCS